MSQGAGGVLDRMAAAPTAANPTSPVVTYDRETARRYLQALSAGFDQPSADAALQLRNDGASELDT